MTQVIIRIFFTNCAPRVFEEDSRPCDEARAALAFAGRTKGKCPWGAVPVRGYRPAQVRPCPLAVKLRRLHLAGGDCASELHYKAEEAERRPRGGREEEGVEV